MLHPLMAHNFIADTQPSQSRLEARATLDAEQLYQQVHWRGRLRRLWAALTRRSHHLLTLAEVEAAGRMVSRHFAGVQSVLLHQIRGSASTGRERDFDLEFFPLQEYDRQRWKNVAAVWQSGQSLPPVELVQVGQTYYVQDGHHRISVARALGQAYIDAVITVWEVQEPAPELSCLPQVRCLTPA
ncbi:MAG: hypothetical protein KJ077_24645 [Anaerolineae bacterium]|nr:hypothetical protein [Anaerolineae bacterium]